MLFSVYFIGSTKRFWPGNKYNSWWVSWTSFFYQGMDDIFHLFFCPGIGTLPQMEYPCFIDFNLLWLTWHNVYTSSFELGIFVLQVVIVFLSYIIYLCVVKNVAFYPNRSYWCLCPTEIVLLRSQRKKERKKST
jgi:hypothetical protein